MNLYASTSGTDSDWVVKLIDVYPGVDSYNPPMGGYELPIATDIFRGRYRTSFEHPEAIAPDQPLLYHFGLPMVNHVFKPGHRIMVQVQSTLFPLVRPQPANLRAEHLRRQAGGLRKGDAARLAHARRRQLHRPARSACPLITAGSFTQPRPVPHPFAFRAKGWETTNPSHAKFIRSAT